VFFVVKWKCALVGKPSLTVGLHVGKDEVMNTNLPEMGRWNQWGTDIDQPSIAQMQNAMALPVSVTGALMPDAHVGYGLPIGGVLATRNAVVPYAVGVDIACRMKMTVVDLPLTVFEHDHERKRLRRAIEENTRFGMGAEFEKPHSHDVLDMDWTVSPVTHSMKRKAQSQLGTSGTGNHFVEFGVLEVIAPAGDAPRDGAAAQVGGSGWFGIDGLAPGKYVALLSHSGSRGPGAQVCNHYSKLATQLHPELSKELSRLAWLDLDTQEGKEYWDAMNLMGQFASANHGIIHRTITKALGAEVIAGVENHHNFAWKETHVVQTAEGPREQELIVHRKGATPAGAGVYGVIPGSMATPGFVVRGLGSQSSLRSASHGAGRVMSRTKAREAFAWGNVKRQLAEAGVEVISCGLDEVPGVYKDIHSVMAAQKDLVEVVASFHPRMVKMAPDGEKAED
jgi:tRNA-splicing ligase RtcB